MRMRRPNANAGERPRWAFAARRAEKAGEGPGTLLVTLGIHPLYEPVVRSVGFPLG